jgi:3-(3-hydroxy-phenyl)propionate hydroxylase
MSDTPSTSPRASTTTSVDVVVVGMGPVGTLLALLLGRKGHRVVVAERQLAPYPLPRAVAMDSEIARVLQHAGLPVDSVPDAIEPYDDLYVWVDALDRTLHEIDWAGIDPSGWNNEYFYHQPSLERHLAAAVSGLENVHVHRGVSADVESQDGAGARVRLTELGTGESWTVDAPYVIGADGANSTTRTGAGIEWHDLGYFFDWLVVDVVPGDGVEITHLAKQVCDPRRPTTVVPGGPGRRRWEFMRLEGESVEELVRPERIWELLAPFGVTPENSSVERGVVYTFNSGWAETWRAGRVLLVGDAAHQMPPFAGQGLANGFRDVINLGWKLDLVLTGAADDSLLDSYTAERRPHVADFIEFSMSLGRIICITDPHEAALRDETMLAERASGRTPASPPEPRLGSGVHVGAGGGYLSWQGRVTTLEHTEPTRFDDVFGAGALILDDAALAADLDAHARAVLGALGITLVAFGGTPVDGVRGFDDIDGTYREWLSRLGARAVLVRPDFYTFGTATDGAGVAGLVSRLGERACLTAASR